MPFKSLLAFTKMTLQHNRVNLTLSINKLLLWQHWRNYNQITHFTKYFQPCVHTLRCLPANYWSCLPTHMSKLLNFVLIYGKYEVIGFLVT